MTSIKSAQINEAFELGELKSAIELKGSVFTLTVLKLHHPDLDRIAAELSEHIAQGPRFFENAPIVIDLDILKRKFSQHRFCFATLTRILRDHKLIPVGVRNGNLAQHQQAALQGLAILKGGAIQSLNNTSVSTQTPPRETPPKVSAAAPAESAPPTSSRTQPTKIIKQPVRSGQQVYARGGDLILLGAVNAGAEVIADGNIHIYAPLRGRALAGVHGNDNARIFCQCFEAQLIAIAGHYQVFEDSVPEQFFQQAVQIYLDRNSLSIAKID